MSAIDFPENVHPLFAPSTPMSTDAARLYLARNTGLMSMLVLSDSGESVVLTRASSWTRPEAEALARRYDYEQFAWVNADLTNGAGVMTGVGRYEAVNRRLLQAV